LIEEGKRLGGPREVQKKCNQAEEEYNKILSELAELLEEKGFVIEQFKNQLSKGQFNWLNSKRTKIKEHLKGIEII
jgi:hypothetical protein